MRARLRIKKGVTIFGSYGTRYVEKEEGDGVPLFSSKNRKDFDGKTQAVRSSLIAHLEEIEDFANERWLAVRGEKNKKKARAAPVFMTCERNLVAIFESKYDAC